MVGRKKLLKAAALAAVIIIPTAAAAWYFWPKDIYIYIFAEKDPYTYAISLNGDAVMDGSWEGSDYTEVSTQFVRFAEKSVGGFDFVLGVSVNGSAPLKTRCSIFEGDYVWIYLYKELLVLQARAVPPGYGQIPG